MSNSIMITPAAGLNRLLTWAITYLSHARFNFAKESEFTGKSRSLIYRQWREKLCQEIARQEDRLYSGKWSNIIAMHYTLQDIRAMQKKLEYINRMIANELKPVNEITEEMIEQARQYPIEQLIEFNRHGVAIAFCHDDTRSSLTWDRKRNRATCFPCGKSYDTIAVLMQRDGMTFERAVRELG